jgi:hypothetical protein
LPPAPAAPAPVPPAPVEPVVPAVPAGPVLPPTLPEPLPLLSLLCIRMFDLLSWFALADLPDALCSLMQLLRSSPVMFAHAAGTFVFDACDIVSPLVAACAETLNASAIADASAQDVNVFMGSPVLS